MLTRLKVSGFKNLVGVDVRFGPFTCVAGVNGVGKSNLFDAIKFLSALADRPFIEAALAVRNEGGRASDVRSLFHHVGHQYTDELSFETEMIVPAEGLDDLGQPAQASITFLRYALTLAYRGDNGIRTLGNIELIKEELTQINLGDAPAHLLFPHKPDWRRSAVLGRRTTPFISTVNEGGQRIIELHQDGRQGRPLRRSAANLPRTVLSVANAAESPTVLLARREMQAWRLLQLEPSALRQPDEFTASTQLGTDGSHLAATLYHLARFNQPAQGVKPNGQASEAAMAQMYGQVANRLAELIDDIAQVGIDRDERRELLTLQVTDRNGTLHPAQALSDGTLRFLALAVLELDPATQGLICLEEPENGVHPERIPAMLRLLQDIVTDVTKPIGIDNPLRQVIINTHSPAVVSQIQDDSLLIAESKETVQDGQRFKGVCFSSLPNTWRQDAPEEQSLASRGNLLAYLNPVLPTQPMPEFSVVDGDEQLPPRKVQRVIDRPDLQPLLFVVGENA
jgi:predicted ATPase